MQWTRGLIALVAASALAACGASDVPTAAPPPSSAPGAMEQLAIGMAAVFESPDMRSVLLQSMRASQLVSHKLPLDQWLHSTSGRLLASRLAEALTVSADSVHTLVRSVAPVDLYLPAREDRLSWRGDVIPVVLIAPDTKGTTVRRAGADGSIAEIPDNHGFRVPVALLQRSDGRSIRIVRQGAAEGAAIQDEDDGEEGGTLAIHRPGKPDYVIQLADLERPGPMRQQYCPPEIPGCPGYGGDDPPGGGGEPGDFEDWGTGMTYLTGLQTQGVDDNGVPGENNEFKFTIRCLIGYDVIASATYTREGVPPTYSNLNLNVLLFNYAPYGGAYVDVDIVETDSWPNGDDNFDLISYNPVQVFTRIPLDEPSDKQVLWPLKEQPNIAWDAPFKAAVRFNWTN